MNEYVKLIRPALLLIVTLLISLNTSAQTSINYGETLTGSISVDGEVDTYTFNGGTGDNVILVLTENSSYSTQEPLIRLYDPLGHLINSETDAAQATIVTNLPRAGQYRILVSDNGDDDTGNYALFVQRTFGPGNDSLINYGQTVSSAIDTDGDIDTYTFNGTAGDSVIIVMTEHSSYSTQEPFIRLYNPSGGLIEAVSDNGQATVFTNLPSNGLYTILASDSYAGDDSGNYTLFIQRTFYPGNESTINYGQTISSAIDTDGDIDTYTFNGTAGDSVIIVMTEHSSYSTQEPFIRLYNPSGGLIESQSDGGQATIFTNLPSTGLYTILASDSYAGDDSGNYAIFVQRTFDPGNDSLINYGQTVSSAIDTDGDIDTYTFNGTAGDSVIIVMTEHSSYSTQEPFIRLYNPSGGLIESQSDGGQATIFTNLPSTGLYTILASDTYAGDDAGNYAIFVQRTFDPGNDSLINYGQTVSSDLFTDGDIDTYSFNGTAGDSVIIVMTENSSYSTQEPFIRLYNPTGGLIESQSDNGQATIFTNLPSTGLYTILASDSYAGDDAGIYSIFVQRTFDPGNDSLINYGQTVSSAIDTDGDIDTYTFNGTAGDSVIIVMTEHSSYSTQEPFIRLYNPSGGLIESQSDNGQATIFTNLPSTGLYTILASDSYDGDDAGNYAIFIQRTFDPGNAIPIYNGDTLTGFIDTDGDVDTYSFYGESGDNVTIGMIEHSSYSTQEPFIRLYNPTGGLIASHFDNVQALIDTTLGSTGNYTILAGNAYSGDGAGQYDVFLLGSGNINTGTDILSFSFLQESGPSIIDAVNHTVEIEVQSGTDITDLTATFILSHNATAAVGAIPQQSGITANDFTNPVTYTVTAEDEVTVQDWVVTVNVASECTLPPDWTVNPADYEYNGQANVKVFVHDIPVESGYLGVFVGDECRGYVGPSYFPPSDHYVFTLIFHSNEVAGEAMHFRYFDDINCEVLEPFAEYIEFVADTIIGNALNPLEIHYPGEIQYYKDLVQGWTWISFNVEHEDMRPGNLLTCVTADDYIKNQTLSATYYEGYGWFGSLEDNGMDIKSSFKIRAINPCASDYMGMAVDVAATPIDLVSGWNWISYLPQCPLPIADALASLTLEQDDYIKNQTTSATYYEGYGWFGSLETMEPTDGYMMRKQTPDILTYPECPSGPATAMKSVAEKNIAGVSLDPHKFEFNGSVTARVYMDGENAGSEDNLVLVYVGDQLRGVIGGIYFEPTESFAYPLMIYSNIPEGEKLTFKYYDTGKDLLYPCEGTLIFYDDMIEASAFNPLELHVKSARGVENPFQVKELLLDVYPNPVKDILHIEYTLAERSKARIAVYDMLGQLVEILDERTLDPGSYEMDWNAGAFPVGTYFLKLTSENSTILRKIVLIK